MTGYVSFGRPLSSGIESIRIPLPFPNTTPFLTPRWTDDGDHVLYYRVSDDEETLAGVSAVVTKYNAELIEFQPKMALIATMFIERNEIVS